MEFLEFWKNYSRMCDNNCKQCKLNDLRDDESKARCIVACAEHPKEAEKIVEKWAKENPPMTNADKFEKVFGFDVEVLREMNRKDFQKWRKLEFENWSEE